jgi:hypothetical protein
VLASSFLAWIVVALVALPLTVVIATGSVMGSGSNRGSLVALSIGALLLVLVAQPLVAAGMLKALLSAVAEGQVTFGASVLAMFSAMVITLIAAAALPPSAALPVLGYSWTGALGAGWMISR